jgi:uncharacterized repeat protein (TIGR02543 family)
MLGRLFGGGGLRSLRIFVFVKENGMKRMMFSIGMLAMALAFGMAGCLLDLGVPRRNDGQETQPKAGVLTVIGAKDGVSYEAEVYDYPDDDVADAADLADLMSRFEIAGTGLDIPGEEALAIELLTPDGEYFTADGDFLVVLKDETDAMAPLRYKGAVTFTGGSATVEYDEMETAIRRYTVTFDLNYTDAANPPKPQEIDAGGKATQPAVPVRTGYIFGGWFTDAAGTGAAWDFTLNTVKGDTRLYAKWAYNYTVTFDLNYTDAANPPKPQEIGEGGKATQPAVPAREGYAFGGWFTDATGTGAVWNFALNTVNGDTRLYAKWKQITYTVTFYLNDESGKAHASQTVAHNGKAVPAAKPTRTDYDFDNWYAANAKAPYDFNSPVTAGLDLLAKWKPLTFAAVIADMAENKGTAAKTYSLSSENNIYNAAVRLTAGKNSPASVTIDGGGTIITGNTNTFTVGSGVTLTLTNITFTKIPFIVNAGGTLVLDNGAVVTENAGAGITVSEGILEMNTGALVTANNSSGVTVQANGVFTMRGGTISGNIWPDGGRYYYGGGVRINAGIFNMSGGEISGNYADQGGGVELGAGVNNEFNMSGGVIKDNQVEWFGGGVFVRSNSTFNMTGG